MLEFCTSEPNSYDAGNDYSEFNIDAGMSRKADVPFPESMGGG